MLGAEHPDTLVNASNLAASLMYECKYAEAEATAGGACGAKARAGAEHLDMLTTANNLASFLLRQGKRAHAERIQLEAPGA